METRPKEWINGEIVRTGSIKISSTKVSNGDKIWLNVETEKGRIHRKIALEVNLKEDKTPPDLDIFTGGHEGSNRLFRLSATDNLDSKLEYEVKIDGRVIKNGAISRGAEEIELTERDEKISSYNVIVRDNAGNVKERLLPVIWDHNKIIKQHRISGDPRSKINLIVLSYA